MYAEIAENNQLVAALESLAAAGDRAPAVTAGGGEVVLDARPLLSAYDGVVKVCEAGGFSILLA
jgi:hypothetical protein